MKKAKYILRAGIGVALRCLAFMENEIYKNW